MSCAAARRVALLALCLTGAACAKELAAAGVADCADGDVFVDGLTATYRIGPAWEARKPSWACPELVGAVARVQGVEVALSPGHIGPAGPSSEGCYDASTSPDDDAAARVGDDDAVLALQDEEHTIEVVVGAPLVSRLFVPRTPIEAAGEGATVVFDWSVSTDEIVRAAPVGDSVGAPPPHEVVLDKDARTLTVVTPTGEAWQPRLWVDVEYAPALLGCEGAASCEIANASHRDEWEFGR